MIDSAKNRFHFLEPPTEYVEAELASHETKKP